jgi:hypothetical protein
MGVVVDMAFSGRDQEVSVLWSVMHIEQGTIFNK